MSSLSDMAEIGGVDWSAIPALFRTADAPLPAPWDTLFGPLRAENPDGLMVVGQIGQSLDGRIATESGHSHYINEAEGLAHLHRLRALVDAVVVGIGTVLADDPQLTVRRVTGPHPARVALDPRGRLPAGARMLAEDGVRRLVIQAAGDAGAGDEGGRLPDLPPGVERVVLPCESRHIAPAAILAALAERGFRRILIEGGANTVSRFLAAGCLDRLHVVVAPLILGSGPAGITLPPVARVDDAMRIPVTTHRLGPEVLWDCDLSAYRIGIGRAKTST